MAAITTCIYQTKKGGKIRSGFAVCKSPGIPDVIRILDLTGANVTPIWNFELRQSQAVIRDMCVMFEVEPTE